MFHGVLQYAGPRAKNGVSEAQGGERKDSSGKHTESTLPRKNMAHLSNDKQSFL